jgi:dolichol kinase
MDSFVRGIDEKKRFNVLLKEIVRKIIHLGAACVPFCLNIAYTPTLILLTAALIGYCVAELLRCKGISVPVVSAITAAAARKRDENKFVLGPVTLAAGVIITAIVFDKTSASIGIFGLAFGDGLASLVGKCFGKTRIPFMREKTSAGSIACFSAVFIATFAVVHNAEAALITAVVGMLLEILPLKDFDNLLLPIALAALNQFLLPLFPLL